MWRTVIDRLIGQYSELTSGASYSRVWEAQRIWQLRLEWSTKFAPPEAAFSDEVLKVTLYERDEGARAVVEPEAARSAGFTEHLPTDPGFIRRDERIVGELYFVGVISDPLDSPHQGAELRGTKHRLKHGIEKRLHFSDVHQLGHTLILETSEVSNAELTVR